MTAVRTRVMVMLVQEIEHANMIGMDGRKAMDETMNEVDEIDDRGRDQKEKGASDNTEYEILVEDGIEAKIAMNHLVLVVRVEVVTTIDEKERSSRESWSCMVFMTVV